MHCAQFVNAVYPDLPPRAPELASMAQPGLEPKPGDVLTSSQPAPWGHVGIMTEQGTVIHSIPGRGVHESSMAAFEASSPITGVIPR
jgi:cell wall-associated NlpC family hydrolase